MQDLVNFLSWLGLILVSAAGFSLGGGIYLERLNDLEVMALGLCVSIVAGSGAFLIFHRLARWVRSLSPRRIQSGFFPEECRAQVRL
jgi:hypothetical protein